MIKLKRAYDAPAEDDGFRVLVERLWPRGIAKARARLDLWDREIAPSTELRQWFAHDPAKWEEFSRRYEQELAAKKDLIRTLAEKSREMAVTLVYAAHDEVHNSAVVLKRVIEESMGKSSS